MLWGGELLLRDGVPAGQLTSAAWGEALGGPVGLGYLRDPAGGVVSREFLSAGRYQVNVGGELSTRPTVTLRPPFDPDNTRVRYADCAAPAMAACADEERAELARCRGGTGRCCAGCCRSAGPR